MKYFVKGNLKHNGRRYKAGDEIELSEAEARVLAHAVQTEPVSAPEEPAAIETPSPTPEVSVGGERMNTGEPSIDGSSDAARTEAEDVTPVVGAPEEPAATPKPETKRGQSGRAKQEKGKTPADVEPTVVDPSANL